MQRLIDLLLFVLRMAQEQKSQDLRATKQPYEHMTADESVDRYTDTNLCDRTKVFVRKCGETKNTKDSIMPAYVTIL